MAAQEKRLHVFVSGSVQGVFFRSNTRELAAKLGIKGFVRNLPDGRVEVIAEGPEEKLRTLEAWLRQGPPSAVVDQCEAEWEQATGEFKDFGAGFGY